MGFSSMLIPLKNFPMMANILIGLINHTLCNINNHTRKWEFETTFLGLETTSNLFLNLNAILNLKFENAMFVYPRLRLKLKKLKKFRFNKHNILIKITGNVNKVRILL
jgi:hypothetical protein